MQDGRQAGLERHHGVDPHHFLWHTHQFPELARMVIADGGLRLDGLPVREGYALNVYLSGQDGEGTYLAGVATGSSFEASGPNGQRGIYGDTLLLAATDTATLTTTVTGQHYTAIAFHS